MRTSRSRSRRTTDDAGLTLLELVIVMMVVSALMGIGIGAFSRLDTAEGQALSQVRDALRAARLFALRESSPAVVVVEPERGRVFAIGNRRVGNWHFEAGSGDGWPSEALLERVERVPGVIGDGLRFARDGSLLIEDRSAFRSPWGFGVEVFVAPDEDPRPMTLLEKPGSWALRLDVDDRLEIELMLAPEGDDDAVETFRLTSEVVAWSAERYSRLTVTFDGYVLVALVDGARVVEDTVFRPRRRLVASTVAPIGTGDDVLRFRGRLDELRLMSVVSEEVEPLPEEIRLLGDERLIHVDAYGHLDPAYHGAPESVAFEVGEPARTTTVEFGLLGQVHASTGGAQP